MPEDKKPTPYNLPSNSKKNKDNSEETPDRVVEKVISGTAIKQKKPLGSKIMDVMTGDDAKSAGTYVLFDVVVPAIKDMIVNSIKEGADMVFYGQSQPRRGTSVLSGGGRQTTPYSRISTGAAEKPTMSARARAAHDFGDIILENRIEAETVLDGLMTILDQYDVVTVADLYDLVDIEGQFTDNKWGWTDLKTAGTKHVRGGYLLMLPRPEQLN